MYELMKCPNCMGRVVRVPGTSLGECESCGSRFSLGESTLAEGDGTASGSSHALRDFSGFDFEAFFADFFDSLDPGKSYDFSCASHLDNRKGKKRVKAARERFGVGADERVFFVYDATIMGSCKKGFALSDGGFYCCDEADRRGHLTWDEFASADISGDDLLSVNSYTFVSSVARRSMLYDMLRGLQG